jgi:UDP-N-acetylglucosamine 1-carboxyvinyltransferase
MEGPDMDHLLICGGRALNGTVDVSGSKNAALPALAACLLSDGPVLLHRVPRLSDTESMCRLLSDLGCRITRHGMLTWSDASTLGPVAPAESGTIEIEVSDTSGDEPGVDIARAMRASISVLGPMLARRGRVRLGLPGGCSLGDRPVDLHTRGLERLGARLHVEDGCLVGTVDGRLKGTTIFLGGAHGPTVLGTINVMSAATLAEGTTRIVMAACEPEVKDCADLLIAMGAKIQGAGSSEIIIEGVERLGGASHAVIPDRIEAGTFALAVAACGGHVMLRGARGDHLVALLDRLAEAGVHVADAEGGLVVHASRRPRGVEAHAWPYPGLPTDLQPQLTAMLAVAEGRSMVVENVFTKRFDYVPELSRMDARIKVQDRTAVIEGLGSLVGATVTCPDLRAGAALVLAGLVATGTTRVERIDHVDRGYERIERKLSSLGAEVERVEARPRLSVMVAEAEPARSRQIA